MYEAQAMEIHAETRVRRIGETATSKEAGEFCSQCPKHGAGIPEVVASRKT